MAVFIIRVEKEKAALEFIDETNKRLSDSDLAKNPFYGSLKGLDHNDGYLVLVEMTPIWPVTPFVYLAILTAIGILLFHGPYMLYVIPFFFFAITWLWTETWLYIMLRLGLRKKGYIGKVKKLVFNDERLKLFI